MSDFTIATAKNGVCQWKKMRETEKNATFPASVGHICQDIEICKIWTAHAQFCFLLL